jgi:hypothetical protein
MKAGTDSVDIVIVKADLFGRKLPSRLTERLICGRKGVRLALWGYHFAIAPRLYLQGLPGCMNGRQL